MNAKESDRSRRMSLLKENIYQTVVTPPGYSKHMGTQSMQMPENVNNSSINVKVKYIKIK